MKTILSHSHNKPALIGLALIAFPILFWIAVISEQLFHNEFLQENLIMKIDNASSALSILLFILFPMIALIVNLYHIARLRIYKENDELVTVFRLRQEAINLAIIIFCLMNILILFAYSITENFVITPR